MPEEAHWEKLLDVELILRRLKIDGHLGDANENTILARDEVILRR